MSAENQSAVASA